MQQTVSGRICLLLLLILNGVCACTHFSHSAAVFVAFVRNCYRIFYEIKYATKTL
ncbi:hypothetical protein CHU_2318 [Cytophaga hutchinsonii ATCC 33406]|uniref:Uncharacterized protein n=1 Tax=Cytophaga hutchinsonii (strain ATCC 33406 / DSM 1761 / CIP 103989 / NBRC 15051 / NCIMB 9469 / D465) TaxID=269798 RepID=A0A6N4ST80_CYTH3|nr:hypothetical protein CHU_2318 [Cytophaga hutchinsonii ATCC 33406]